MLLFLVRGGGLPQAGRAQECGCGIPKHKRCSGAGLPVPPLSTNHPPAFQFRQVLHAGDREETARAQMGGRRKTKQRSTGWLCPRWKDRGLTSRWALGMPGICPLFSSSGSLQLFRGCVPVPVPVPLAGTTGEEAWWGLAYLAVAQTWPHSPPSDRSLCCFAGARPPGCSFRTGGGGDANGRAGKPKTAFTGDSSPVNKGLPGAPQQPAG